MLLVKSGNLKTKARRMFTKVKPGKVPSTEHSLPIAKDPGTSGTLGNAQGANFYSPVQTFLFCFVIPLDCISFSAEYLSWLVSNLDSVLDLPPMIPLILSSASLPGQSCPLPPSPAIYKNWPNNKIFLKITLGYSRNKWRNKFYFKRARNYQEHIVLKNKPIIKILEILEIKMYFWKNNR